MHIHEKLLKKKNKEIKYLRVILFFFKVFVYFSKHNLSLYILGPGMVAVNVRIVCEKILLYLIINPTRYTNFTNLFFGMKLYMFRTVPLSIIRNLFTVHSAMAYVIQVCGQPSSRTKMEIHSGPARRLPHKLV